MELVSILRLLWRRRVLAALGVLVAIVPGVMLARSGSSIVGFASTRIVIDTPHSQFVNTEPAGSDTLGIRTELLADLALTDTYRSRIASEAKVPADQLNVVNRRLSNPKVLTKLPTEIASADAKSTATYGLALQAYESALPIIAVEAQAPDPKIAARLVNATVSALQSAASSAATVSRPALAVSEAAPPRFGAVVHRPRRLLAIVAILVTSVLWCMFVVLLPRKRASGHPAAQPQPA